MFKKQKLRKQYDQNLIRLMETTKQTWLHQEQLEKLSFETHNELRIQVLLAKSKYFFLFNEAKVRKISLKRS